MVIDKRSTVKDVIVMLKDADFLDSINIKPESLSMTYGQRIELSEAKTLYDMIILSDKVMNGAKSEEHTLKKSFVNVYPLAVSVIHSLEQMAKRDADTFNYTPTPEEVKAGFYNLNHGIFGTIDKLAQRLRVKHDEILAMQELTIYTILKIDFENSMYQRRLQKVIQEKK